MANDDNMDPLASKTNKRSQRKKVKIRGKITTIRNCADGDVVQLEEDSPPNVSDPLGIPADMVVRVMALFRDTGEVLVKFWDAENRHAYGNERLMKPFVKVRAVEIMQGGILCPISSSNVP